MRPQCEQQQLPRALQERTNHQTVPRAKEKLAVSEVGTGKHGLMEQREKWLRKQVPCNITNSTTFLKRAAEVALVVERMQD